MLPPSIFTSLFPLDPPFAAKRKQLEKHPHKIHHFYVSNTGFWLVCLVYLDEIILLAEDGAGNMMMWSALISIIY